MDISSIYSNFTGRQRLLIVVLLGTIVVAYVSYSNETPQTVVAPPKPVVNQPKQSVKDEVTPVSGSALAVRDPFAVPKEYQPAPPAAPLPPGRREAGASPQPPAKAPTPALFGIVNSNGNWSAILQYNNESKSYRAKEFVGPYQILSITQDAVTLWGPSGRLTLAMGR